MNMKIHLKILEQILVQSKKRKYKKPSSQLLTNPRHKQLKNNKYKKKVSQLLTNPRHKQLKNNKYKKTVSQLLTNPRHKQLKKKKKYLKKKDVHHLRKEKEKENILECLTNKLT